MTGKEVLAEGLWFFCKRLQVLRPLEFIATRTVEVVHQNPILAVVQLEYSAALHMRPRASVCIQILKILLIRSRQFFRRCLLDAVLYFLTVLVLCVALVEEVIHAVLVDDVVVYRTVLGGE